MKEKQQFTNLKEIEKHCLELDAKIIRFIGYDGGLYHKVITDIAEISVKPDQSHIGMFTKGKKFRAYIKRWVTEALEKSDYIEIELPNAITCDGCGDYTNNPYVNEDTQECFCKECGSFIGYKHYFN